MVEISVNKPLSLKEHMKVRIYLRDFNQPLVIVG